MARTRPITRVTAAAALLVALVTAATGAPASATDPATLSVTPATDLLDGHEVTVTATGLVPGQAYVFVDCADAGCVDDRAYYLTISTLFTPVSDRHDVRRVVTADAEGRATARIGMARSIRVGPMFEGTPTQVDCAVSECSLAATRIGTDIRDAVAPVSFAPTGTYVWPTADAEVVPPGPDHHGSIAHVTGSGFDGGYWDQTFPLSPHERGPVFVTVCATDPAGDGPCVWKPADQAGLDPDERGLLRDGVVTAARDGTVDDEASIPRFVRLSATEFRDCAVDPCALLLGQPGRMLSDLAPFDMGSVWAPWPSAAAMVDHLSTWVGEGRISAADRALLAEDLATGQIGVDILVSAIAARATAAGDVATLYATLAGRRPDLGGLDYWIERIRSGLMSTARAGEVFASTAEIRAAHAALDDGQTVDWAYQRTLGRTADPDGRAYWLDRLEAGLSRAKMLAAMALAPESRSRTGPRRTITAAAAALRDRAPTAAEWAATAPVTGTWAALRTRLWVLIAASDTFRSA